jgi:hypothetical protein
MPDTSHYYIDAITPLPRFRQILILIDADAIDIIAIIEFYADIASQRFHCCRLRH